LYPLFKWEINMSEILGVLFAALLGLSLIPGYLTYQKESTENIRAVATAQQQRLIYDAATKYLQQNNTAVLASATPTTPVVLTVPMLQTATQTQLPVTNPYGQNWQVQVLEPTAGSLQAVVTATGGDTMPDKQAVKIGSLAGATGGFIPTNDSGGYPAGAANAWGSFGGWKISMANYSGIVGGRPAALLTVVGGQVANNYLYRNAVPGQPQLNTMNTPLIMASVQTNGAACAPNPDGAIAADVNGAVLSCQGGQWQAQGDGKCVATASDLNLLQTDGRCYNSSGNANSPAGGDWFFLEVYRHTNLGVYYTAQRVVGMTGPSVGRVWQRNQQSGASGSGWSAWVQQADSQVSISSGGNVTAAGDVDAGGNLWTNGQVITNSNINMAVSGTTISNPGRLHINAGENLYLQPFSGGQTIIGGGGGASGYLNIAGNAETNDIYIRSIGKWASQLDQQSPGSYVSAWGASGSTGWANNTSGRTLTIQAFGGNASANQCALRGDVNTVGTVASMVNNNPDWAKTCSITFQVPSGAAWIVNSNPINGTGNFSVLVYQN
jgi:hypothetical protein